MEYIFVRHGESEGNVNSEIYLQKEDHTIDLTPKGEKQAKEAAVKLADMIEYPSNAYLFYSPYLRAKRTAKYLIEELTSQYYFVHHIQEDPLLREREWGVDRQHASKGFFHRPNGGESYADCYQRCVLFDLQIRTMFPFDDKSQIIIVAHGEFIRCYRSYLEKVSADKFDEVIELKNGEIHRH